MTLAKYKSFQKYLNLINVLSMCAQRHLVTGKPKLIP